MSVFDQYCLILRREFQEGSESVAYLPGDSLHVCFKPDGGFDQTLAETFLAPHGHHHLMVAMARAERVPDAKGTDWQLLVLSRDQYFEAIFLGDILLKDIQSLRVSKAEYNRMWDLAFANFGRKLGDAERALVQDFIQVHRAVAAGALRLETI